MIYFIIGLIGTLLLTVISIFTSLEGKTKFVLFIFGIALAFFGQIFYLCNSKSREQNVLKLLTDSQNAQKESENHIKDLEKTTAFINTVVGDLSILDKIGGTSKYYIRIAADESRSSLEKYLKNIDYQFKGAVSSGLVEIRNPRPSSKLYELVFGKNLSFTAAEVMHRLAMSHRLTPPGQIATILPEIF